MVYPSFNLAHPPRELRRRVILPARVRIGARWSDACILNISSRGMMIQTGSRIAEGSVIEIRRADYAMFAKVVWREGAKAGLRADERLPVEDIMALGGAPALQVTAAEALLLDRRRKPRPNHEQSRLGGRALEFAAVAIIAIALSGAVFTMVREVMTKPFAMVKMALAG